MPEPGYGAVPVTHLTLASAVKILAVVFVLWKITVYELRS
jgi:hypothetical protein